MLQGGEGDGDDHLGADAAGHPGSGRQPSHHFAEGVAVAFGRGPQIRQLLLAGAGDGEGVEGAAQASSGDRVDPAGQVPPAVLAFPQGQGRALRAGVVVVGLGPVGVQAGQQVVGAFADLPGSGHPGQFHQRGLGELAVFDRDCAQGRRDEVDVGGAERALQRGGPGQRRECRVDGAVGMAARVQSFGPGDDREGFPAADPRGVGEPGGGAAIAEQVTDAAGVHLHQARPHPRGGGTGRGQLGGTSVRELVRAVLPQRRGGCVGAGHAPSLPPDANV